MGKSHINREIFENKKRWYIFKNWYRSEMWWKTEWIDWQKKQKNAKNEWFQRFSGGSSHKYYSRWLLLCISSEWNRTILLFNLSFWNGPQRVGVCVCVYPVPCTLHEMISRVDITSTIDGKIMCCSSTSNSLVHSSYKSFQDNSVFRSSRRKNEKIRTVIDVKIY